MWNGRDALPLQQPPKHLLFERPSAAGEWSHLYRRLGRLSLLRPAQGSIPDNVPAGVDWANHASSDQGADSRRLPPADPGHRGPHRRREARLSDGSDFVFSGGSLVSGELHTGPEPDWSFTNDIVTIELQLEDPPRSRTIWVGEHDGKLYVFSAYMRSAIGRLWKSWPLQAERDGRAVLRIDDKRYERQLRRIESGPILEGITASIADKYTYNISRELVRAGDIWLFEAAPRGPSRPRR